MKTAHVRSVRIVTALVVLTFLVMVACSLSRTGARIQNNANCQYQAGPVLPGSACNDLLNGLSAIGGR